MVVKKTEQTQEEKDAEQKETKDKTEKLSKTVTEGLGLSDVEETEEEKAEREAAEAEETEEEKAEREAAEAEAEEEPVAASKVKKLTEKFNKRIQSLTAKLKIAQAKPKTVEEAIDADQAKLEKMPVTELRQLKARVRVAQIKEKDDDKKLEDLVVLEGKIDETIQSAPQRFLAKQIAAYNSKAEEIVDDPEIDDIEEAAPIILKVANKIYAQYPKLQRLEEGQAMALEFAVAHYKDTKNLTSDKSKAERLKRANTKLKRKTTLGTSALKGSIKDKNLIALRAKAKSGTAFDKEELIRKDPAFGIDDIIPDEFKEG